MISFIIPAHNEEQWIGKCLDSIQKSITALSQPYEIIVVDDASTDATSQIAERFGARVIHVEHRKVSAVRNAGVSAARGELLFFVDADTEANIEAVSGGLGALRSGAVGGGCVFQFDGYVPLWGRIVHRFGITIGRLFQLTGGCFVFCTRDSYDMVGGFSEQLHVGEDMAFVQALKRLGNFVLLKPTVVTSARKLGVVGFWEVIRLVITILLRGPHYESKKTLDFMYGKRAQACRNSNKSA